MVDVKRSLNQFSKFVSDESATDLEQIRSRHASKIESDDNAKSAKLSQGAIEFLEKFDKRKLNQLIELSHTEALVATKVH